MSHQQTIRIVRPTKIELIRLRKRLRIARRLHKVLKDRLIILTQELIGLIREAIELRNSCHSKIVMCMYNTINTLFYVDPHRLSLLGDYYRVISLVMGQRVVAGVRVPLLEVEEKILDKSILSLVPLSAINTLKSCYDLMKDLVKLAELESSIMKIGREVLRVKRRVNALEYILIPRIEATIKFLEMKFEEREREDKVRLKRVKEILARRSPR